MSAGTPNFQRLAEMGKLPPEQLKKLPHLAGIDETRKELNRLREGMCENCHAKLYPGKVNEMKEVTQLKCAVDGCSVMVGGHNESIARQNLKQHVADKHPN